MVVAMVETILTDAKKPQLLIGKKVREVLLQLAPNKARRHLL
jgi:hypothetical protein